MAVSADTLALVRQLEVRARREVRDGFLGRWRSSKRGSGIEFAEVREYTPGDDARTVDWNVSARSGRLQVKRFDEEREQAVCFLVDVSASCERSPGRRSWRAAVAETIALLGLSAARAGDRVGLAFGSDEIERVHPPRAGVESVLWLLARLLEHRPTSPRTDADATLRSFLRIRSRPCVLFWISDFHDEPGDATLVAAARRHDLVAVTLRPELLARLPEQGLWTFADPESGRRQEVDLGHPRTRRLLEERIAAATARWQERLRRAGASSIELFMETSPIDALRRFCRERALRIGS